ncbi:MAG: hypothetical protein R6U27_02120 [Desulfobacterales bacterium]
MTGEEWSLMSEKEKKMFEYSVPWQYALKELSKTYSEKEIFNLIETGGLSYFINLIDESKPHGLDALWIYGSDKLEDFLRDYNVWFYRDALSDILWSKPEGYTDADTDTVMYSGGDCPSPPPEKKNEKGTANFIPLKVSEKAGWEDIFIVFSNKEYVQIKSGGETFTRAFHEIGFSDLRKDKNPIKAWKLLLCFSVSKGTLYCDELNEM